LLHVFHALCRQDHFNPNCFVSFFTLSTYSGIEIEAAMKRALVNKNNSEIQLTFPFLFGEGGGSSLTVNQPDIRGLVTNTIRHPSGGHSIYLRELRSTSFAYLLLVSFDGRLRYLLFLKAYVGNFFRK